MAIPARVRTATTPWSRVLLLMKKKGLGSQRIANILGVSLRTVNRWLDGAEPRASEKEALEAVGQFLEGQQARTLLSDRLVVEIEKARQLSSTVPLFFEGNLTRGPDWYEDLKGDFGARSFPAVWKYGNHFAAWIEELPSPAREAALNMLATSAFWMGKYEEARVRYDALRRCESVPVRTWVLSNLGCLQMTLGDFDAALADLAAALQLSPSFSMALYNRLCVYSLRENAAEAENAAVDLLLHHADYDEAGTEHSRQVMTDPDLRWFRSTASFGKLFPRLTAIKDST